MIQTEPIKTHIEISTTMTTSSELSAAQKRELRKQRFNKDEPMVNTLDALQRVNSEKEKKLLRAKKFGLVTKELEEEKKQERAAKFGLIGTGNQEDKGVRVVVSAASMEGEKRNVRAVKFGLSKEERTEEEEKRKKRLERFKNESGPNIDKVPGGRVVKRVKM